MDKKNIELPSEDELKKAASLLGRKGGLVGGKARAEVLTPKRRHDIAVKAAKTRWHT